MKNLILTALLVGGLAQLATAQILIEGEDIRTLPVHYIEIVGQSNIWGTKVRIQVDFGQKYGHWGLDKLTGPDGKPLKLNTMMEALNLFYANGWKYLDSYIVQETPEVQPVIHFILERRSDDMPAPAAPSPRQ
ncbi:MAG: hypothetical protein D6818_11695 [Bacteroidetes bacterium]|nr:MAG: hypothetical protein D6818_11695 [Bacteroidota bacterium]